MVRGAIAVSVAAALVVGAGYALTGGFEAKAARDAPQPAASVAAPAPTDPAKPDAQTQASARATPTAPVQMKTRGLGASKIAQQFSNKCRVPNGSICYVQAQPVGSTCNCPGNQNGIIVW